MQEDEIINGCMNCHLVNGDIVACFNVGNTNLSVQENEILPYRRTIDNEHNLTSSTTCNASTDGKIRKDTMKCEFSFYNGNHLESDQDSAKDITLDCNKDNRNNQEIFQYLVTL